MEKLILIDAVGRTVLQAIREAANLGKGGPAKIRLAPWGIIQIETVVAEGRRLKKVGKFLVAVNENKIERDADADVRARKQRFCRKPFSILPAESHCSGHWGWSGSTFYLREPQ